MNFSKSINYFICKLFCKKAILVGWSNTILCIQVKSSNNYLALRNESGHYFINGDWRIDFTDDYEAGGTIFHYEKTIKSGKGKPSRIAKLRSMFAPEQLRALGPTKEPLYVVVRALKRVKINVCPGTIVVLPRILCISEY